jgi:hypothetical protein
VVGDVHHGVVRAVLQVGAGALGRAPVGPSTPSHQGAAATAPKAASRARGCSDRWNTNELPYRSASVTCPVARTKSANRALVTAVASIRNGSTRTVRTGPSPSSG